MQAAAGKKRRCVSWATSPERRQIRECGCDEQVSQILQSARCLERVLLACRGAADLVIGDIVGDGLARARRRIAEARATGGLDHQAIALRQRSDALRGDVLLATVG